MSSAITAAVVAVGGLAAGIYSSGKAQNAAKDAASAQVGAVKKTTAANIAAQKTADRAASSEQVYQDALVKLSPNAAQLQRSASLIPGVSDTMLATTGVIAVALGGAGLLAVMSKKRRTGRRR